MKDQGTGGAVRSRGIMGDYMLWLLKTFTFFLLVFIMVPAVISAIMVIMKGGQEFTISEKRKVAVLELSGPIMSAKEIVSDLYKYAYNDDIEGIVLRIDSPGGAVGPSQEIYEAVKRLKERKPIIASMASVAASGGLYASLAATKVLANPGTVTGSVGVIMQFPNFQEVADKIGIDMVTIKSGKLKDVGNPFRDIEQYERDYLLETIQSTQDQFVAAVVEGRGLDEEKVRKFADGRILTGLRAKELGLVDRLGGLQEAARVVFEEKNEPLEADELPTLIYPADKFGKFKELLVSTGVERILGFLSSEVPKLMYSM